MAGGGIGDVFSGIGSALGGALSSLGGMGGGGGSSAGTSAMGGPDLPTDPTNAPTNVLTNPIVGAEEALSGNAPGIQQPQQQQQQQPPQPPQQPTFTTPPQTAPQQFPSFEAMDAATKQPNYLPPEQQQTADPNSAQPLTAQAGVAPAAAASADTAQATAQTDQSGQTADQQSDGQQGAQQQQQGQQKRNENPLTQAGNFLKNLAKPHSAPAPSPLASLLNRGPGGLLQDLMGLTNQVGPAYGPQEYSSQGATEHGYGYGAGETSPAPPAVSPPTQPAAPQPPPTAAVANAPIAPSAATDPNLAAIAQQAKDQSRLPGGNIQWTTRPGMGVSGSPQGGPTPTLINTQQAAAAPAPGMGANPAADRWVSPQHVSMGQLAGTDTPPTPGYSTTMRDTRARLFEQMTPQDKILAAGMMQAENAKDPIGPMESLANRAAANNMTMGQLLRSRFYGPGASFARRGMAIQRSGQMPHYEAVMAAVQNGSNVLGGATDQGSGRDPNVGWTGGRIRRSGEVYNDWGGGRGHAANAKWRREIQARVRAENQPPTAVAATEPQRMGGDLEGVVRATSQLAPRGLPTESYRRSTNVEDARRNPFMTPLSYPTAPTGVDPAVRNDWLAGLQSPQRASTLATQAGADDIDPLLDRLAQQWAMQLMGGQVPMPRPRPRM